MLSSNVLAHCFSFLDAKALLHVQSACVSFREIVASRALWHSVLNSPSWYSGCAVRLLEKPADIFRGGFDAVIHKSHSLESTPAYVWTAFKCRKFAHIQEVLDELERVDCLNVSVYFNPKVEHSFVGHSFPPKGQRVTFAGIDSIPFKPVINKMRLTSSSINATELTEDVVASLTVDNLHSIAPKSFAYSFKGNSLKVSISRCSFDAETRQGFTFGERCRSVNMSDCTTHGGTYPIVLWQAVESTIDSCVFNGAQGTCVSVHTDQGLRARVTNCIFRKNEGYAVSVSIKDAERGWNIDVMDNLVVEGRGGIYVTKPAALPVANDCAEPGRLSFLRNKMEAIAWHGVFFNAPHPLSNIVARVCQNTVAGAGGFGLIYSGKRTLLARDWLTTLGNAFTSTREGHGMAPELQQLLQAGKCTREHTDETHLYQPWYCCGTCELTELHGHGGLGLCATCVASCHAGHDTWLSDDMIAAFCDCNCSIK